MLINLTPNIQEIERRKIIAKENNFEYIPQSDPKWIQEIGIYQSSFPFNFPDDEFVEKLNGYNYNELKLKKGETILQYYSKNKYVEQYGVADSIEQIKKFYKKQIKSKTEKIVITAVILVLPKAPDSMIGAPSILPSLVVALKTSPGKKSNRS